MIIDIVHQLRMARGSISKMRILHEHHDNEDWLEFLKATYDTSINYNVSAPNDNTFIQDSVDMGEVNEHLKWLTDRVVTGNSARAHALEGSETFGELYRLILKGSIKAGVSITTINKVYPGLISVFKVMLAKEAPIHTYPCVVSTKYDGVRLLAFVVKQGLNEIKTVTTVSLILRSGKQIHIKSLECEMSKQPPGVYDGELVAGDGLQEGRTKITGSVNRCLKGGDTDIDDYTFCVFDCMGHDDWNKQESSVPYLTRIEDLNKMEQSDKVRVADMFVADCQETIDEYYADRLEKGYEGVIVRYFHDGYVWGRTNKLIKKKATKECVLTCVGITEGTGKYAGMVGALVCEGKIGTFDVSVKLGSGLTDHDREMPADHYVGHDIDVLYNDLVVAKGAKVHSLFLPRFKRLLGMHDV